MLEKNIIDNLNCDNFADDVLACALAMRGEGQRQLFELARMRRHVCFPKNNVQVRSVIEVSNICRQGCRYCSIGGKSQTLNYSLSADVVAGLVEHLYNLGRRVILLQSGENINQKFVDEMAKAISIIKEKHDDMKLILCMGSLKKTQYEQLRQAGAEAYILKFEASNPKLFSYCRPNDVLEARVENVHVLHDVGFEVGSGNIVGLPTQTIEDLVSDLKLVAALPLAMNSATIFSPAENSVFEHEPAGNPDTTLNFMALMRIMNPHRLMPTTSSLEKLIPDGQFLGLMAGANTVTIHDGTPEEFQAHFPIYSTNRTRPQVEHFKEILNRAHLIPEQNLE